MRRAAGKRRLALALLLWAIVVTLWVRHMLPLATADPGPATTAAAIVPVAQAVEAPATTPEPEPTPTAPEADAVYLAQCLWGEARGIRSQTEKAAVAWCVLNRVDHPGFPDTVYGVLSAPNQFIGFSESYPVDPELLALAQDVLTRWHAEQTGADEVGRVLPKDYLWFSADGHGHNAFRNTFRQGAAWQWTMGSPYTT